MRMSTHINSACGLVRRADGCVLLVKTPGAAGSSPAA